MFLNACSESNTEDPQKNIIDKELMSDIILDMNVAEIRLARMNLKVANQVWQRDKDFKLITEKYNLPDSTIKTSYDYYVTHPELFKEVIELSIKKLEKMAPQDSTKANES